MRLDQDRIRLGLYTIGRGANWRYVGDIGPCEVLRVEQSLDAHEEFTKRGWLEEMAGHVEKVAGNPASVLRHDEDSLFNVRFMPRDARLYERNDPAVIVQPDDPIRKLRRYTLVELTGEQAGIEARWPLRAGTHELRPTGDILRRSPGRVRVAREHNEIQNALFKYLKNKFGVRAVTLEERFVDITLRHGKGRWTLIEVKSDPRPRIAIREALGQLLEYAFSSPYRGRVDLVVAGPGEVRGEDMRYLEHLRSERNLPVNYLQVRRDKSRLELAFAVSRGAGSWPLD